MTKAELIRSIQSGYVARYTAETEDEKQFINDQIYACTIALSMICENVASIPEVPGLRRISPP